MAWTVHKYWTIMDFLQKNVYASLQQSRCICIFWKIVKREAMQCRYCQAVSKVAERLLVFKYPGSSSLLAEAKSNKCSFHVILIVSSDSSYNYKYYVVYIATYVLYVTLFIQNQYDVMCITCLLSLQELFSESFHKMCVKFMKFMKYMKNLKQSYIIRNA